MAITYTDTAGNDFELPKLTPALAKAQRAVAEAKADDERYRKMYQYIQGVFGPEYLAVALGGSDFDDIDVVSLMVLYTGIVRAYQRPVLEAQAASISETAQSMRPVGEVLDISERVKATKSSPLKLV